MPPDRGGLSGQLPAVEWADWIGKGGVGLLVRDQLGRFSEVGVLSGDLDDFRLNGIPAPGDVLAQLLRSLGVASGLVEGKFKARRP